MKTDGYGNKVATLCINSISGLGRLEVGDIIQIRNKEGGVIATYVVGR